MTGAAPVDDESGGLPRRPWRSVSVRLSIALVGVNLLWRAVRYGLCFPVWGDEAFVAVNLLERDFTGMFSPLEYGQIVPLGFMWAELVVTRVLGLSEWAMRLIPFLMGVGSMLLLRGFARRVLVPFSVSQFCVTSVFMQHVA